MMFIVGIDVAKRSHEVSIITSEGQTVQRAFSISNNCTGYNCLMEKIRKLTNVRSEIVFAIQTSLRYNESPGAGTGSCAGACCVCSSCSRMSCDGSRHAMFPSR